MSGTESSPPSDARSHAQTLSSHYRCAPEGLVVFLRLVDGVHVLLLASLPVPGGEPDYLCIPRCEPGPHGHTLAEGDAVQWTGHSMRLAWELA